MKLDIRKIVSKQTWIYSFLSKAMIPPPNIQLKSAAQPVEHNYYDYSVDDGQEEKLKTSNSGKKRGNLTMVGKVEK